MKYQLIGTILIAAFMISCGWTASSQRQKADSTPPAIANAETVPTNSGDKWQPANFKGIRIGTDSRAMARKLFGKPTWSGKPEDYDENDPEIWENYAGVDEFHKDITVMSSAKTGVIRMIVSHHKNLSVEDAIRRLGDDYKTSKYSLCREKTGKPATDAEDESFILVEDPKGSIEYIEYRNKGIIVKTDDSGKKVNDIEYTSDPIAFERSSCE